MPFSTRKQTKSLPHIIINAGPGVGKCLGVDTKVLLYSGDIVNVQDIEVGDLLMGPDSIPREVKSVSSGYGQLYRINPTKGDSWVCNDEHVMTLTGTRRKKGQTRDIPLNIFMDECKRTPRSKSDWKLFRVGIEEFEVSDVRLEIDPYLVGLWMGDGTRGEAQITNSKRVVHRYCKKISKCEIRPDRNTFTICIFGKEKFKNPYRIFFRTECEIDGLKTIPHYYLTSDGDSRAELLAGILDTDGERTKKGHTVVNVTGWRYRDDLLFLCRSLGLSAYSKPRKPHKCKNGKISQYYSIKIIGDLEDIPTKVNVFGPRLQKKRHNVTGFEIEDIGKGDYFGFTLDGDGRFLLGDFTVTHNTSTMIAGLNILSGGKPEWEGTEEQKAIWAAMKGHYTSIGFQAFNKSIATEIQEKVPSNVKASTFHAFGYKVLRENGYKLKPNSNNVKFIVKDVQGYDKQDRQSSADFKAGLCIAKVVGLLKGNLLEPTAENVNLMIDMFNLTVPDTLQVTTLVSLTKKVMAKCLDVKPGQSGYMDFDDMLWLPLKLGLDFKSSRFDLLICDESQDLNPIQHELVLKSGSRLICVGDRRQSIYGFRGADSRSMDTLKETLEKTDRGVIELSLQTTFRLPTSGVKNVNSFAPDLVAADNAIEGEIEETDISLMEPKLGDLILSRINANIFSMAFSLLRKKIGVRIQGRDFGNQLKKLLESVCKDCESVAEIQTNLAEYEKGEHDRIMQRTFPARGLAELEEKMACLYSLTGGCKSLAEMTKTIDELFSEDLPRSKVVLLSTVHRAKGMEADTVWFLEPQLIPHKLAETENEIQQEFNLKFVAETRHKKKLVYVYPSKDRDDERDEAEGRMVSNQDQPEFTS